MKKCYHLQYCSNKIHHRKQKSSLQKMADTGEHPDNVKAEHEGWKDIKDKKRGCTDCLFLVSDERISGADNSHLKQTLNNRFRNEYTVVILCNPAIHAQEEVVPTPGCDLF